MDKPAVTDLERELLTDSEIERVLDIRGRLDSGPVTNRERFALGTLMRMVALAERLGRAELTDGERLLCKRAAFAPVLWCWANRKTLYDLDRDEYENWILEGGAVPFGGIAARYYKLGPVSLKTPGLFDQDPEWQEWERVWKGNR